MTGVRQHDQLDRWRYPEPSAPKTPGRSRRSAGTPPWCGLPAGENNPGDPFLASEDAFSPDGRLIDYDQLRLTGMFCQEVFIEATVVIRGRRHIVVEGLVGFTDTALRRV